MFVVVTASEHVVRVYPSHWTKAMKPDQWTANCSTCWARSVPVMFKANADDWRKAHLAGER